MTATSHWGSVLAELPQFPVTIQNISREFLRRSFLRENLSKTAQRSSTFKFRRNIAQAVHDSSEFLRQFLRQRVVQESVRRHHH